MPWLRVRDVLARTRKFHEHAKRLYEKLGEETDEKREELLARRFEHHEKMVEVALSRLSEDEATAILDAWIQNPPETELDAALEKMLSARERSRQETVEAALVADHYVLAVYRQLAESMTLPRHREFFEDLATLTEERSKQKAWNAREVEDI